MRLTIAAEVGACTACSCRYRPGEMIALADRGEFHLDCYRTRDSIELRPYEAQQPVEMDLLLIAIQNEGVSSEEFF
ncbi:MAG: hypothetical protein JO247_08410 [Chloroflexi bacterium]|nr:hypothetical protein [Chloroflexota bacterium]